MNSVLDGFRAKRSAVIQVEMDSTMDSIGKILILKFPVKQIN